MSVQVTTVLVKEDSKESRQKQRKSLLQTPAGNLSEGEKIRLKKLMSGEPVYTYCPVDSKGNEPRYKRINQLNKTCNRLINKLHFSDLKDDESARYDKLIDKIWNHIDKMDDSIIAQISNGSINVMTDQCPKLKEWADEYSSVHVESKDIKRFKEALKESAVNLRQRALRKQNPMILDTHIEGGDGSSIVITPGYDVERILDYLRTFYKAANRAERLGKENPGKVYLVSAC